MQLVAASTLFHVFIRVTLMKTKRFALIKLFYLLQVLLES